MTDTVIDLQIFEQLAGELASPEAARRIVALYLELLDGRIARLVGACVAGDESSAMDAVLSLKVSSAMVGAVAMRDLAAHAEECLLVGGCAAAQRTLQGVRRGGIDTARALEIMVRPGPR